jgi:cytochrome c
MKSRLPLVLLFGWLSAASAFAGESAELKELLQASGCLSCHSVEEKIVGPAFKSVAAKYANDADAVATLSQSIKNGSRGKWGRMAMPPHSTLTSTDLTALSAWVMTHKP